MEKKRIRFRLYGDVQGVGLRFRASHAAGALGVTVLRAGKAHYFSGGMKGGFHFENTIMPSISVHGMI